MENYTLKQKMMDVLKRYGYYMLLGIMLLTIVTTLIVVAVSNKEKDEDVSGVIISAYMPILNATIHQDYSGNEFIYNETLKQWETHKSIDFVAATSSKVYSIFDGVVEDVYENSAEGTVVVILHDDGLKSSYGSLDEEVFVKIGENVSRGQEIGTVSDSAGSECSVGAHLHFTMYENDKKINPASYLDISTK